jgi:hypothetical protein
MGSGTLVDEELPSERHLAGSGSADSQCEHAPASGVPHLSDPPISRRVDPGPKRTDRRGQSSFSMSRPRSGGCKTEENKPVPFGHLAVLQGFILSPSFCTAPMTGKQCP